MDSLKSTKVDWRKLTVVFAIVLLTGLVVGLGVWYYMGQQVQTQAEYYEEQLEGSAKETTTDNSLEKAEVNEGLETVNTHKDSTGNYTINLPSGYIASVFGGCEGLCTTTATVNKKNSEVTYNELQFKIIATDYSKTNDGITIAELVENHKKGTQITKISGVEVDGVRTTSYSSGSFSGNEISHFFIQDGIAYVIEYIKGENDDLVSSVIRSFSFN